MPAKHQEYEIFRSGATWLRADFHLHTKADKEFSYQGDENDFISAYVNTLKAKDIRVGVIANHNKFKLDEFKALRKKARQQEIFLLPGIELSVNDGANGIHTVIIFSDEWLKDGTDLINQFLHVVFKGKLASQYENTKARTSTNIIDTLKELEGYNKDFMVIFAHVEQDNGLWNELDGGRLSELSQNASFRKHTVGFQKVRTYDKRDKVKTWLSGWYPAEVEGSDCKSIDNIGDGNPCYLKIGSFSFDAVKYALIDKESRVANNLPDHIHSHIRSIRFTGGTLDKQELYFSPELNTLIGIRGSGKSSILEAIRYALEIPFGEKASDQRYKQDLVEFTLGSGGKIEIDATDRHGQDYTIRKILRENYSSVLIGGKLEPGVSIRETVLHKPIYFGQKDLSNTGEGFERDLVDKLLGSKLDAVRRKIEAQKTVVVAAVERLQDIGSANERLAEQEDIKRDTEYRLKFYKDYGVEEKLQKRLDYDTDLETMQKALTLADDYIRDLEILLSNHEDDLRNMEGYTSQNNQALFDVFYVEYAAFIRTLDRIKSDIVELEKHKAKMQEKRLDLDAIRKNLVEEFAEIERKLAEQLKDQGVSHISTKEFLSLKKKLNTATQLISELTKQGNLKHSAENTLLEALGVLNDLWYEEFNLIKRELDKVVAPNSPLSITSGYKSDRQAFLDFMKNTFRGSGIREVTYQRIVEKYHDFIDIYRDFNNAQAYFGSNPQLFIDYFMDSLKLLLTYQTPNKFTLNYRGKELQHHSLGQRASALILFVLSQKENDLIIIDQPEDDLDNQTIYEDVIKLIKRLKPSVQFILATHNPNIPVLGDAEQILACSFKEDQVVVNCGSVDDAETQRTIVDIMEGGQEAFERRKEIYQIWKMQR